MKLLLLIYFAFLPFQWALSPAEGIDLALIRVVSLVIAGYWLVTVFVKKRLFLPIGWEIFFFASFLFLAVISLAWAEERSFAERKLLFLFSFVPLFLALCDRWREYPQEKKLVLRAFVGGALVLAVGSLFLFLLQFLFGVEQIFSLLIHSLLPFFLGDTFSQAVALHPSLLVNISGMTLLRASGIFPDPHMFAFYMGMALPFALAFAYEEKERRRFWFVVAVVLLLADLLSFSRGGYIGLLCGGGVLFFGYRSIFSWSKQRVRWVIFALVLVFFGALATPLGGRFMSIFSAEDGSNKERLRLWGEAATYVGERPLLGVGLGNYPLLVKPGAGYREPIYAHNMYLDIVLELGLLGLGSFLFLFGLVFIRLVYSLRSSHNVFALSTAAALAVFLGHGFFETPLFSVHIFPVLLLLLSLGVSYGHDRKI